MKENWNTAVEEISKKRDEVIEKLLHFSLTDMLLFWSDNKELLQYQKKLWQPVLDWVQQALKVQLKITNTINVPQQDENTGQQIREFLIGLNDKELAAFFKAALNMRSVLLAAALVKGKIGAEEAFEAAYAEEIWQAKHWGSVEEAEQKRQQLKEELLDIESFLRGKN